jgi:hypothetical protein
VEERCCFFYHASHAAATPPPSPPVRTRCECEGKPHTAHLRRSLGVWRWGWGCLTTRTRVVSCQASCVDTSSEIQVTQVGGEVPLREAAPPRLARLSLSPTSTTHSAPRVNNLCATRTGVSHTVRRRAAHAAHAPRARHVSLRGRFTHRETLPPPPTRAAVALIAQFNAPTITVVPRVCV